MGFVLKYANLKFLFKDPICWYELRNRERIKEILLRCRIYINSIDWGEENWEKIMAGGLENRDTLVNFADINHALSISIKLSEL